MNPGKTQAEPVDVKVGELLTEADIVSSAELTEAIQVAKRLGVPIGRTLLMSGFVREDVLEAALQAQSLLRDNKLPLDTAVKALRQVHDNKIDLNEALKEENLNPDYTPADKLAALLLDSNIVDPEELEKAMETSAASGIPLGSALVLQGVLSPALFPSVQRIQEQLSHSEISRDEAIKAVQKTFLLWVKAEESLNKGKATLEFEKPIIKTNPEQSTANVLDSVSSLETQTPQTPSAVKPLDDADYRLVDLLKAANVFSQADVQSKYQAMLRDPRASARFFLSLGLLSEEEAHMALANMDMLKRGQITREQAIDNCRTDLNDGHHQAVFSPKQDLNLNLGRSSSVTDRRRSALAGPEGKGQVAKVIGGALAGMLVAGLFSKRKGDNKD
ncbi:MAG: hypothetical protein J0H83_04765 [Candidatus Melainabacteria bacterium]|jgi:hypothetical protein|nr:hypothetical protein [Candidatus Melainabacteria bacterium]MBX9672802.1 hypothetical protein [Candidatus Obscuribacterales bacterium]